MRADLAFPFTAIRGQPRAARALLVSAVDDRASHVLLIGGVGTGKSLLVSAFAALRSRALGQPVVALPASVDDEALFGGIDLGESLRTGRTRRRSGLLARAAGAVVVIDDLGLHRASTRNALRRASSELSLAAACATSVPGDDGVTRHLADVFSYIVALEPAEEAAARGALAIAAEAFAADPDDFRARERRADTELIARLRAARERLERVEVDPDAARSLVDAARELGVEGSRADVFAWRAARAHAALRGVDRVGDEDCRFAVEAVLAPRATPRAPADSPPPEPPPSAPPPERAPSDPADAADATADARPRSDEIYEPSAALVAPDVSFLFAVRGRRRGAGGGSPTDSDDRGAPVGKVEGLRRGRRLAVAETLRRAALARAYRAPDPSRFLVVHPDDVRMRRFRRRSGATYVFAVDASGSMAFNRMREAKGAVLSLLQTAYVRRDAVALIAFRQERAELLLPPTSSVVVARRALELLPTGGGTPLAAALERLVEVARRERLAHDRDVVAVLVTDGRANVPRRPVSSAERKAVVARELDEVADAYRREGIRTLLVDTTPLHDSRRDAEDLATRLGADYTRLPSPSRRELAAALL